MRPWLPVCCLVCLANAPGCQPAMRYATAPARPQVPPPTRHAPMAPAETNPVSQAQPPQLVWIEPTPGTLEPAVPIRFVTAQQQRAEWNRLPGFWNVAERTVPVSQAVTMLVGGPWLAAAVSNVPAAAPAVTIKVPLGLDDPTPLIPPANPPTLAKWQLGKRVFFDSTLFPSARGERACATCHQPSTGFTNPRILLARNVPTLIDSAYNRYQFWDGRAAALEEVALRVAEDERFGNDGEPEHRHSWAGVVERLRANQDYVAQFRRAFGTPPTQDALGKALATYLRTILSGNSLQDRAEKAMQERGSKTPEPADYEPLLDEPAIKFLVAELDEARPKAEVAAQLVAGYTLFHGKAGCVQCHPGRQYTDQGFHNLGEGDSGTTPAPGLETGRFAVMPAGLKDRAMIGAYKTPTLRALPRRGRYFHNGLRDHLFEVVHIHVRPPRLGPYLDPAIQDRGLTEGEVRALVMFLRALDGEAVAAEVREATRQSN